MSRRLLPILPFLLLAAVPATAEEFPTRTLQILVGTPAGGAPDILARALAEGMREKLGQAVITVNHDGAGGTIAATQVAEAKPDGYTLGFSAMGPMVSQPHIKRGLHYTLDSFTYLCQTFDLQIVFTVNEASPWHSFTDFMAAAKAEPGKVSVGHAGPASVPQIALAQLEKISGIKVNQIPFRGDGQTVQAIAGNQLDAAMPGLGSISGFPSIRPLAIFAAKRESTHPDIPTVSELGYHVVKTGFGGLFGPKDLPAEVKGRIESACEAAVQTERYRSVVATLVMDISYLPEAGFKEHVLNDYQENGEIIRSLNIGDQGG